MRLFAVSTLVWLPLVLLYADQGASALPPDGLVKIRQSSASTRCSPPVITTRSVRFYSVKTAGGTTYVRQLIYQDLLACLSLAGLAVQETAQDFATCANTAEKKKKSVFQFANGVCTTYAAVTLPPCPGVGDAVVYVATTAGNSTSLPSPTVAKLTLTAVSESTISASWMNCFVTQYNVSYIDLSSTLVVSTAGVNVTDGVQSVVITSSSGPPYNITGLRACGNYRVTVTPVDSNGRAVGTPATAVATTLPDNTPTPTFVENQFLFVTLDNITMNWSFLGCSQIATYNFSFQDKSHGQGSMSLNKSVTSVVLMGIKVCAAYNNIQITAIDSTGGAAATTGWIQINGAESALLIGDVFSWPTQNACYLFSYDPLSFSDSLLYCQSERSGELLRNGSVLFSNFNAQEYPLPVWFNLQYWSNTSQWVWGSGEVEAVSSSDWHAAPDASLGHCVSWTVVSPQGLTVKGCTETANPFCFRFY